MVAILLSITAAVTMIIVVPGHGTHDMLACGPEVLSTQHHVNLGELN